MLSRPLQLSNKKRLDKSQSDIPPEFITSPTDVAGPCKATLQDFKVTEKETKAFKDLCEKYSDVFLFVKDPTHYPLDMQNG